MAGSGEEGLAMLRTSKPPMVLLSAHLPDMDGLDLFKRLQQELPQSKAIFFSTFQDMDTTIQAMKLGACDFIEKPFRDQALLDAISQAVRRDLDQRSEAANRQAMCDLLGRLSPRELDVARLVAEGLPNKLIGQQLLISERTVQVHRQHLMDKLEIHSAAELAQLMLRAGTTS